MSINERYIQFPLFLLRDLHGNKQRALNDMLFFGLYNHAKRIRYKIENVAAQLVYCYHRKQEFISDDLMRIIGNYEHMGKINMQKAYKGFNKETFSPDISQLLPLFEKDDAFRELAIKLYYLKHLSEFFDLDIHSYSIFDEGKRVERRIKGDEPLPMVNLLQVIEFRDNEVSEFDLFQFACNISIRSILGKSLYTKTNKQHVLSRALGYKTVKQMPTIKPELFMKYLQRYHFDKLKDFLECNWYIHFYSNYDRGFYVGLESKISLKDFIAVVEARKIKNKALEKKAEKQSIKKGLKYAKQNKSE